MARSDVLDLSLQGTLMMIVLRREGKIWVNYCLQSFNRLNVLFKRLSEK